MLDSFLFVYFKIGFGFKDSGMIQPSRLAYSLGSLKETTDFRLCCKFSSYPTTATLSRTYSKG